MISATELGQMATEYLDDRKTEYDELIRFVKRDRKSREKTIKIFQKEYDQLHQNLGKLLQKEVLRKKNEKDWNFCNNCFRRI